MAYIYEHIRTRGYEPMHFEEHYARLDALSRALFLTPLAIDKEGIRRRICESLHGGGFSKSSTNAINIKCHDNGTIEIECIEMLYNHFSLRALRPQGFSLQASGELITKNTSAKVALLELNHTMAQISNEGVPVWTNELGEVIAIDGAPIIAVFENEIRFSEYCPNVESQFAYTTIRDSHRNITQGAISLHELKQVKELLYIDYRGITALSDWNGHLCMDIMAERIASQVAKAEDIY